MLKQNASMNDEALIKHHASMSGEVHPFFNSMDKRWVMD
jgi:hypothetical protein